MLTWRWCERIQWRECVRVNYTQAFDIFYFLVAGVGFEPTTFRLWAWRATGLLHPATIYWPIAYASFGLSWHSQICCLSLGLHRLWEIRLWLVFTRFGGDLLSHVLRRSTIGARALNGRVRNGTGCFAPAMTTKPRKNQNALWSVLSKARFQVKSLCDVWLMWP